MSQFYELLRFGIFDYRISRKLGNVTTLVLMRLQNAHAQAGSPFLLRREQIAYDLSLTTRTVSREIKRLQELGIVFVSKSDSGNSNCYELDVDTISALIGDPTPYWDTNKNGEFEHEASMLNRRSGIVVHLDENELNAVHDLKAEQADSAPYWDSNKDGEFEHEMEILDRQHGIVSHLDENELNAVHYLEAKHRQHADSAPYWDRNKDGEFEHEIKMHARHGGIISHLKQNEVEGTYRREMRHGTLGEKLAPMLGKLKVKSKPPVERMATDEEIDEIIAEA